MRNRILVAEPRDFPREACVLLEAAGDVDLRSTDSMDMARAFASYDAVLTRLGTRIDSYVLGSEPRTRVLAVPTTGLDHIDLEACAQRGVQVISLRGEVDFLRTIRATAEHTLALTLAVLRNIVPAAASVVAGEWDRDRFRGREVAGSVVGVVGMGRLGTIVADLFLAMGATVVGVDVRDDWDHPGVRRAKDLRGLCASSDVLTLHIPFAPGDAPTIGEAELEALPMGAIVINTSRGGVLNESALLDALESGRVAGAGIDVLVGEPDVADHLLVRYAATHPNLVITPHLGGNTSESLARVEIFIAERVVEALGSRP